MIKFSIITVSCNAEKGIKKTIDSITSQTYPDKEVLIIDARSSDNTLKILEEYAYLDYVHIFSERDFGIYNGMNRGIARASGDYIIFLNAGDTLYDNDVLENVARIIGGDKKSIYYGDVVIRSAQTERILEWKEAGNDIKANAFGGAMPCHQSIFAPLYSLRNHYFREKYRLRADFEWVIYNACQNIDFVSLGFVISKYDTNGVSADAQNAFEMNAETQDILGQYTELFCNKEALTQLQTDKIQILSENLAKNVCLFKFMAQWIDFIQKGLMMEQYFIVHNIKTIAIYGMGQIGERFWNAIKNTQIEVRYAIDQNADKITSDVPVIKPCDDLAMVDMIVVTAITYINEIKADLCNKVDYKIISIKEILDEMMEK